MTTVPQIYPAQGVAPVSAYTGYLAAAGAVSFIAAVLLPQAPRHRLTREFQAGRPRSSAEKG